MKTDPIRGEGPWRTYQQALDQGEFRIQQCRKCRQHVFYPRLLCNHCGSNDLEWVIPSGRATVYSTSVVRQRPAAGPDYNVSLVDLEEGPRMLTRVVGIEPHQVRIGMQVTGHVAEIKGQPAYVFKPVAGAD